MINLLPEKEKKELAKLENLRKISLIFLFVLIAVLFLTFLLFFLKFYFRAKVKEMNVLLLEKQQLLADPAFQGFQQKVNKTNQDLKRINRFFQSQIFLNSVFEEISSILPDSIFLTNFSFQKKYQRGEKKSEVVNNIYISGWAKSREDLSLFKERLGGLEKIKKVYFLPKSWVKPENIDFSLSLEYGPLK